MTAKPKRIKAKSKAASEKARAEELVEFVQDVALGKKKATEKEINDAMAELSKYLPDLPEEP